LFDGEKDGRLDDAAGDGRFDGGEKDDEERFGDEEKDGEGRFGGEERLEDGGRLVGD
jgi:hypothetical protein